ncbi:hypothetical protein GCM10011490_13960 [Pseudoclavibacter endophyticus]|uniref:TetR/AcrR family transcriptional regulator n=1 Tax=Pseudoclavibacter endophyticus TaxID=1778590 RepID=A0A6H9WK22_9MICO|nr:TetR/AcrR family transcriptional regulator [Pseudoclavibacter endophyticus]KAB1649206.1 TetR/AcrR family transcriptional regulator [Pseudoclavibacter endophyticus]GGA64527.1 hypothetical protein GCM10011490_13960 [Pseudoclavibacter endophyticus]
MTEPRTDPSVELRRAALELFARDGYDATSLQDIADRVGYTKANVLYHFGSKQALFEAAVAPIIEEFDTLVRDLAMGDERDWVEWTDRMVLFMLTHEHAVSIFINQVTSLRDQPAVSRVNSILFAVDSAAPVGNAVSSATERQHLRRQLAIAGAAYLIAQRTNAALATSTDGLDDEEFGARVREAVLSIVSSGTTGAPPATAPHEPAAPIQESR